MVWHLIGRLAIKYLHFNSFSHGNLPTMVFSSLRQTYNNMKDPPQQKGAGTRQLSREVLEEVTNNDAPADSQDLHHQTGQEESLPFSGVNEKDAKSFTAGVATEIQNDSFADDDPAVRDIPSTVRRIVSLHDDPTLPTLTFRYFILTFLFVVPGAFLSQLSHFRTNYAPYSVLFVQIASNYAGLGLAKTLPDVFVRVPFSKYGFSLNPGPWSIKEHVLVTISAASGAKYNLA
jgi:hypothetical protein